MFPQTANRPGRVHRKGHCGHHRLEARRPCALEVIPCLQTDRKSVWTCRWLHLEDPELVAVQKEKQRKLDKAAKKAEHLKLFLAGKLPEGSSTEFYDDDEDEEHENEVDEDAFSPVQGNKCVLVAAAADYDDDDNTTTLTKMTTMSVVLETAVMAIRALHGRPDKVLQKRYAVEPAREWQRPTRARQPQTVLFRLSTSDSVSTNLAPQVDGHWQDAMGSGADSALAAHLRRHLVQH
eukprot:1763797-Rhodomonas_salina.5